MNLGAEPPSLDWVVTTDSTSFDVVSNLMVGLTRYTDKLACRPACASSWEVLEAGKRYVFHLRPDIKWSDGKQLVAADFVYAWRRMLNPATAAQYAYFLYPIENAFEYNTGKLKDPSQVGVRAIDDLTLEVRLKRPAAYFIYLTAFCTSLPQRQDVVERFGDRWTEPGQIVTNGAFVLKEWQHEYKIVLAANPLYFDGEPAVKKIKMFMVAEPATAFALYENDELDYVDNRSFSTSDVERCRNSPQYHNTALLRNNYIGFNVTKAPFTDSRVRRAVSMAVDRNIFAKILRRGERPADCWIPPSLAGYSASSGAGYDPELARKLLAEAGFPGGKRFPVVGLLYPNREDTRLVVESIQDQLKRNLNVKIDLINQEWKVYLETLHRDPPPLYRSSWGADYPDPETFMNLFTSHNGNNSTRWSNQIYDQLIEQAEAEQNPTVRAKLYEQADTLLCRQEAPIACTYLSTQNLMVKPWVHGMAFNALDMQFFEDIYIGDQPPPSWQRRPSHKLSTPGAVPHHRPGLPATGASRS
jgi:oligopeptide transport system substrate-binding protein